jgi:hypothetical protein
MAYLTLELEQIGIILNMIAGVLMGLNFFFREERIDKLNKFLERLVVRLKGNSSTLSIRMMVILFIFMPIIIIFLPIYMSNITGEPLSHSVTNLFLILQVLFIINQIIIKRILSTKKSTSNKDIPHINRRENIPILGRTPKYFDPIKDYILSLDPSTLIFMVISAYFLLYGSSVQTEFSILTFISKSVLYLALFLIIFVVGAFLLLGFLMFSPKGVIGSVGAICLIIGSALQLLSTVPQ